MKFTSGNTEEIGRGFGKNAGEWTGRVEIDEVEWDGWEKSRMHGDLGFR